MYTTVSMQKEASPALKLLLLNIEGTKHYPRVLTLLEKESPDVLCLQEVPKEFVSKIEELGYYITYLKRCTKSQDNGNFFEDGIVLASKTPHEAKVHNYFTIDTPDDVYDESLGRRRNNHGVIVATLNHEGETYRIANTHFTWALDGMCGSETQKQDMSNMLTYLEELPPHIFCGDLNIPRAYNSLYNEITKKYTDAIPSSFQTSLDSAFHRMRLEPEKQILLDTFMVDYILTTPGYIASNVRQIFGISDHCATVAIIEKAT
jgi:endonuclease/exonuclease/phosphatase family metal-dependent hydrolase